MRKLIGGKYVRVPSPDQGAIKSIGEGFTIDVISADDIKAMGEDQLIDLLREAGKPAFANWKLSTLQKHALKLVEGK